MDGDDLLWAAEVVLGRWFGGGSGSGEAEEQKVRADLRRLAQLQQATDDARMARSRKLESLGSTGSFFGGLVKIHGVLRPVIVVATPTEFVLLDAQAEANPTGELGRIAKKDVARVRIVDENGLDAWEASIDPVRELETPQEERYTVVLERADGSGTSVSFLFLSGEPALFARNRFRDLLGASPDGP
jgi:hypothetical protein